MPPEIPLPIQYNPYKHHFSFLLSEMAEWQKSDWSVTEKTMLLIGNNLFDFYLGELTPEQICKATLTYFETKNITTKTAFNKWMGTAEWKKITLPDESKWLIKKEFRPIVSFIFIRQNSRNTPFGYAPQL
ncbi:hypothetical protein FH5T_22005 [Draconibacterium orientale]|uniref:Uncharacterized protein n=1 Tax=Draconibacterium orientale TaxID=1168034 RepID=A0ABN4D4Q2_9BACT|nr:hypothetical protein FH5T_22005 [Draconibacterium orientale]